MIEKAQGAPGGAPKPKSDDDPPGQPRIARITAQPLLGPEMQITFDRQALPSAQGRDFLQTDPADLRHPQAQIAKPERMVVVIGINLGQQPSLLLCFRNGTEKSSSKKNGIKKGA